MNLTLEIFLILATKGLRSMTEVSSQKQLTMTRVTRYVDTEKA